MGSHIKCVEEGVKSIHIHNVAMDMDALKEASRKVAAVKNRGPRAWNGDIMANGVVDQWLQQKRIRQQPMDQWLVSLICSLKITEIYHYLLMILLLFP